MRNFPLFTLALLFTFLGNSYAQNIFEFLRLDMSPRAAAMGGSYVSNNDDPNVIFYNPAGIRLLENTPVSFSFLKHLMDINSASLSLSHEFDWIGRIGIGIQYINYGNFTEADEFGNRTGEFGAGELALLVGYANELDANFYYGANIKFIYSGIADRYSTGIAADLGLHYSIPDERWNFGFSILNMGTQINSYYNTEEELPLDIRMGFSKTLAHLPFTFYFSLNKLNEKQDNFVDRFKKFTFGGEIRLSNTIRFRLGYDNEKRKELKIGTTAGLAGFNFGVGVLVNKYNVDYAFSSMGSIGSLHRIGITTTF